MKNIRFIAEQAHEAQRHLALLSKDARKCILERIADFILASAPLILQANAKDMREAQKKKLSPSLLDRLLITKERLESSIADIKKVAKLNDWIGHTMDEKELRNGLYLKRVRVPIGVIGMIYESRPNVTIDAATLCLKGGNSVVLKGGSDALQTNRAIVKAIKEALKEISGLTPEARLQDTVQLIDTLDRNATQDMLQLYGIIDVIIPRGGKGLINFVREKSKIPVIETGASVVHTYIHSDADAKKAIPIILNAKLRRTGICNTLDTLILNAENASKVLNAFIAALPKNTYKATKLEIRADRVAYEILKNIPVPKYFDLKIVRAKESDFDIEFLDYILAIKVVKTLDQAMDHIERHSLKHSEAIITESAAIAERFLNSVDAACVYWNASTQFSDGGQFGLGAEIGISTQKLHVRGPFALEGLTSYKWVIEGNGQIRK